MRKYCSDRNLKEQLTERLFTMASQYLPQWRPDVSDPDDAAAMAIIFAGQMAKASRSRDDINEQCLRFLASLTDLKARTASAAHCVLSLEPDETSAGGLISRGSVFSGQTDEGDAVVSFCVEDDINITPVSLKEIMGISSAHGKIISYLSQYGDGPYPIFSYEAENLYREELNIRHWLLPGGEIIMKRPKLCPDLFGKRVRIRAEGYGIRAQIIWDGESELDRDRAEIFGREIYPYKECCIGQDEVFSRGGADITCSFDLRWESVDTQLVEKEILRPVVRKSRERQEKRIHVFPEKTDITYFNGRGFASLNISEGGGAFLKPEENKKTCKIRFRCPEDWHPMLLEGYEMRCMRIRILEAKNAFVSGAVFHYPVVENLRFHYSYGKEGTDPEAVYVTAQQVSRRIDKEGGKLDETGIFTGFPYAEEAVLFGFDRVFFPGVTGIYLQFEQQIEHKGEKPVFYCSVREGFRQIQVEDGTDGFSRSGVVMLKIPEDADMLTFMERTCFWVKVVDRVGKGKYFPRLVRLFPNAVEAVNTEISHWKEYTLDGSETAVSAMIPGEHILDAQVWVNEKSSLSDEERRGLMNMQPDDIRTEYDIEGRETACFVRWQEAGEDICSRDDGRIYVLDRVAKKICFGKWGGKIPQELSGPAWKLRTVSCAGKSGNVAGGSITEAVLKKSFLKSVENPYRAFGGCDEERTEELLARKKESLSFRGSIITEADLLRQVKMFSDEICQVMLIYEKKVPELLLLLEHREVFYDICPRLQNYLETAMAGAGPWKHLKIREPDYISFSVQVWCSADAEEAGLLEKKLLERIRGYFEDERGRPKFGIGRLPGKKDIGRLLYTGLENIDIQVFYVTLTWHDTEGEHKKELRDKECYPYAAAVNGQHRIFMQYTDT